jgi:16S rRNA processing protein RimM
VVTARIAGVTDRTAAEALKGLELTVDRAVLPQTEEGTFYHADLIGLPVALANGDVVGKVVAFHNYGGGDVMEIKQPESAKTALLPFTADVIAAVDPASKVVIHPNAGLFDEGEAEREGEESDGHAA